MITSEMTEEEFVTYCHDMYSQDYEYDLSDTTLRCIFHYWRNRRPGGHFLKALLTNNLTSAVQRADLQSLRTLPQLVKVLWNCIPDTIWQSEENYSNHIQGG